jgi:hypothetical protein
MAVTSKTDICNLSQDLLSGAIVQDIDNPTTADEEMLERWYDHCRKKTLREHPWKFAIKREIIAASAIAPAFGYTAAFPVPNDFIRLLTIETSDGEQFAHEDYQFESNSILLNTDATSVYLRYIYDIEDVSQFDAMFIDYLALNIALSTAFKVTESNTSVERIAQLEKIQGAMTKAISGQERPPTRIERSKNRQARLNNSSANSHRIIF